MTSTGFVDIKEYELFNMTKTTVNSIMAMAGDSRVIIEPPVILCADEYGRFVGNKSLAHIEKNIFRYGTAERCL